MSQNHHYVPIFYLKRWLGTDGKLCVYVRPRDRVKAYMKYPDATGYAEDLYAISGAGDETANHLEGRFLNLADNDAAEALEVLESGRDVLMDARLRSAWSRFIMRLLHGTPEAVSKWRSKAAEIATDADRKFRENYASFRRPTDPERCEDYPLRSHEHYTAKTTVLTLQTMMDSKHLGEHLNRMAWVVVPLRSSYSLLTSDRPLVMTNGISGPGKHLGMPIGPRLLFIAAYDLREAEELAQQDHDELVRVANDSVVRGARRFVWGLDDTQLRFVERRLGGMLASSPLDV
jgi:hypothetical protein